MIDRHAAIRIVEREMNVRDGRHAEPLEQRFRVFDEFTIERSWGWVMYFGTSYADFDEQGTRLASRYPPCLVDRRTGALESAGAAWPVEKYIEDFETRRRAASP